MFELRILEEAIGDLRRLEARIARRILVRLRWLARNFDDIRPNALAADLAGLFKLRVGDYRAIYEVLHEERPLTDRLKRNSSGHMLNWVING